MFGVPRLRAEGVDDIDLILADAAFDAFSEALQPANLDISEDDMTMIIDMQDGFSSWSHNTFSSV